MATDIALVDVRDRVLRKLGRNVVNFQKMEAMLKLINTAGDEQIAQGHRKGSGHREENHI